MNIFNLHSLAISEFTSCAFLLSHTFGNSRYSRRFVHKLNTRSNCIQLQYGGIHPKLRSLNRTLSVSSGIRCSEISPSRPAKSSECCVIIEGCKNWQFCSQNCTAFARGFITIFSGSKPCRWSIFCLSFLRYILCMCNRSKFYGRSSEFQRWISITYYSLKIGQILEASNIFSDTKLFVLAILP